MKQEKVHLRILIIAGVALFWMAAVFARVCYVQLYQHSEYLLRAGRQQRRSIQVTPKRGTIYDRNMQPLAMSVGVDSVFANPAEVKDVAMATRLLSGVLGMPAESVREALEGPGTFAWIKRKLPPGKVEAIKALNLKGIYFQSENQRYYPKREMGAHIVGFVDLDENGLAGIEHEYDELIRGKGEKVYVMTDARQQKFDRSEERMDPGAIVVLTIDEKIQYIAERELEAAIARTHAPAGTVIVQDPNTGAILALANWPKFNLNSPLAVEGDTRMNRAVSAIYEPGSTFKLVTLAAAFDQKLIRADQEFFCENGKINVAGHIMHDHKPYGMLTVAGILANSSDVGAIKIALLLGPARFYDYIKAFGFGSPTGIDLPGESRGILQKYQKWGSFSIGSISMGQEVGVTPVQMISAVSAIANGGLLYKPRVVQEIRRGEKTLPLNSKPSALAEPKRVVRPETAATMRSLMEGVVLVGTGKAARLDGWTAAGKTGTAQKIDSDTGRYSAHDVIASFTGFAPINNPAVTILVSIDSPGGWPHDGGAVAAPVFKKIAEQVLPYLNVARDVPLSPKLMMANYHGTGGQNNLQDAGEDDLAPVDFPGGLESPVNVAKVPAPAAKNSKVVSAAVKTPEVTVVLDEGGEIAVPDFRGKNMREVTEACLRLGLEPVLVGSSLATQQSPAAGMKLRRGAKVTVEFGSGNLRAGKAK